MSLRTVLAYPGNMAEAQNAALALAEAGALEAYVTTFAYRPDGLLGSFVRRTPSMLARRSSQELARRAIDTVPPHLVRCHPLWEVLRTAASKAGAGPVLADLLWDRMSHRFDALVARRYVPRAQAVQAYEYTALASFERAKAEGVAKILHLPSLDSLQFETIQRREKCQWPDLAATHDAYFDRKFARRYERRRREIALADAIVANSSLTARSHIAAGADPAKVLVVQLAAPPPVTEIAGDERPGKRPLEVIWAGSFSLGKGAHYLLEAWRLLRAGASATLHVYGQPQLPANLAAGATERLFFHGSVSRAVLFEAYQSADVLVFPTLSDGFGMVVTEAMAHGLPVITTDQAGAAELVSSDNGLIVPAADSRALAHALQWCLDNRDRLHAMRFHALETARHRQWRHFRRDLIAALGKGLRRAGYNPEFGSFSSQNAAAAHS
jgi:glycosyltransferase involved in cell wall biosynthesis